MKKIKVIQQCCLWLVVTAGALATAEAATYYVSTSGNNGNLGSQVSPWLTITYAAGKTTGGDTVRVQPGTYNERVSVTKTGSSGLWINFVADGQVICRGFSFNNVNYVRVVNFEITHVDSTYSHGFILGGTSSHLEILDNYVHDIQGNGVRAGAPSTLSYITIRGNRFYYLGNVPGYVSTISVTGIGSEPAFAGGGSDHWLVEYNEIQKSGDFSTVYGEYVIQRNNYYHDMQNSYWANGSDAFHSDGFQPGSDGKAVDTKYHLYEANFCGDSAEFNGHFGIWQDTVAAGDTDIVLRGNIGFNYGSGAIGVIATKKLAAYNNTFYKTNRKQTTAGNVSVMIWRY